MLLCQSSEFAVWPFAVRLTSACVLIYAGNPYIRTLPPNVIETIPLTALATESFHFSAWLMHNNISIDVHTQPHVAVWFRECGCECMAWARLIQQQWIHLTFWSPKKHRFGNALKMQHHHRLAFDFDYKNGWRIVRTITITIRLLVSSGDTWYVCFAFSFHNLWALESKSAYSVLGSAQK